MKTLDIVVSVLLIIGGLNWGLIGFFQFDLVAALFGGQAAAASRLIYALVGLSAIYEAVTFRKMHERWCGFIGHQQTTRI
jgi:uncharacterized membrane protein YuzA (DUF378 family)